MKLRQLSGWRSNTMWSPAEPSGGFCRSWPVRRATKLAADLGQQSAEPICFVRVLSNRQAAERGGQPTTELASLGTVNGRSREHSVHGRHWPLTNRKGLIVKYRQYPFAVVGPAAVIAVVSPSLGWAQVADATGEPKTRQEVRVETADFMKMHRWDETQNAWVPDDSVPRGSPASRAEVHAEMHEFLRGSHWEDRESMFVPNHPSHVLSNLTCDQVRTETVAFVRTHHWDEPSESWVSNLPHPHVSRKTDL